MITESEREVTKMITIKNACYYATQCAYIVYRMVDGEAWFFSAWDDLVKANSQAREFGLCVADVAHCDLQIW